MSTNPTPSIVHRVTSLSESLLVPCLHPFRDASARQANAIRKPSESLLVANAIRKPLTDRNILQIVQNVQETICKKQLIESATNLLLSISGGQDSIFLLFCLSFLQTQISFTFKLFWCNHFWQTDSFYTTLHLTKYGVNLSFPLLTFVPLHDFCLKDSERNLENNQALTKLMPCSCLADALRKQGKKCKLYLAPRWCIAEAMQARVCYANRRFTSLVHPFSDASESLLRKPKRSFVVPHYVRQSDLREFARALRSKASERDEQTKANRIRLPCLPCLRKASARHELCGASCLTSEASREAKRYARHEQTLAKRGFAKQTLAKRGKQGAFYAVYRKQKMCQKQIQRIKKSKNFVTVMHLKKFTFFNLDNVCNSFFQNFLPFRRQSWQISHNYIPSKKIGDLFSEGIARNWRHITTERSSSFYTLEKTIYGHTLSDKIETIVFNLIRGAGKSGMTPLLWKRKSSKFSYNKFYCSFERIQKNTHLNCT